MKPLKMKAPSGEIKEVTSGRSGIWVFLFGFWYLAYRGLWRWFFISLALFCFIRVVAKISPPPSEWYLMLIYVVGWAIFAAKFGDLLVEKYERDGWEWVSDD